MNEKKLKLRSGAQWQQKDEYSSFPIEGPDQMLLIFNPATENSETTTIFR